MIRIFNLFYYLFSRRDMLIFYPNMIFILHWLNISWMVRDFFFYPLFQSLGCFVCIPIPLLLSDPSQRVAKGLIVIAGARSRRSRCPLQGNVCPKDASRCGFVFPSRIFPSEIRALKPFLYFIFLVIIHQ